MNVSSMTLPLDALTAERDLSSLAGGRTTADAARQFEAVFASLLLKTMRESMSGDGLIPGDGGDVLGGLFDQFLGEHISQHGGLGLAASLQRSLGP